MTCAMRFDYVCRHKICTQIIFDSLLLEKHILFQQSERHYVNDGLLYNYAETNAMRLHFGMNGSVIVSRGGNLPKILPWRRQEEYTLRLELVSDEPRNKKHPTQRKASRSYINVKRRKHLKYCHFISESRNKRHHRMSHGVVPDHHHRRQQILMRSKKADHRAHRMNQNPRTKICRHTNPSP